MSGLCCLCSSCQGLVTRHVARFWVVSGLFRACVARVARGWVMLGSCLMRYDPCMFLDMIGTFLHQLSCAINFQRVCILRHHCVPRRLHIAHNKAFQKQYKIPWTPYKTRQQYTSSLRPQQQNAEKVYSGGGKWKQEIVSYIMQWLYQSILDLIEVIRKGFEPI